MGQRRRHVRLQARTVQSSCPAGLCLGLGSHGGPLRAPGTVLPAGQQGGDASGHRRACRAVLRFGGPTRARLRLLAAPDSAQSPSPAIRPSSEDESIRWASAGHLKSSQDSEGHGSGRGGAGSPPHHATHRHPSCRLYSQGKFYLPQSPGAPGRGVTAVHLLGKRDCSGAGQVRRTGRRVRGGGGVRGAPARLEPGGSSSPAREGARLVGGRAQQQGGPGGWRTR